MSNKRILLVDDEEMVLDLTESMLEALDYEVTPYLNVKEALQFFCDHPDNFDLIVTDQSMPQMNGVEFAKKIRDIAPAIPVIIATGFTKEEILAQLDTSDARFVLEKPFTLNVLESLLDQACP